MGLDMTTRKSAIIPKGKEIKEVLNIDDVVFSNESMEVRSLVDGYNRKNIIVSVKHQRNFVWNEFQQSYFIATVLFNIIPVPPFQFYRNSKTELTLKVTDSQQRLVTLSRFKNNLLRLDLKGFPIKYITVDDKQYDIIELLHGKYYEDLPQKFRSMFNRRSIRIDIANNCPDSYSELFYVLYNTGIKALKPHEIRLASMGEIVRSQFTAMINYDIFKYTKLSYSMKLYKSEYDIVAIVFMMLFHNQACDLTSYKIDRFINQFRIPGIPANFEEQLHNVFKYMSDVVELIMDRTIEGSSHMIQRTGEERNIKFLSKANLVMISFVASKAMEQGLSATEYALFLVSFFNHLPKKYKDRLESNLNGLRSNKDRLESIMDEFEKFCDVSAVAKNKLKIVK
jgi:hypothetical protein